MIKLISGFHVSVQDLGRFGHRNIGVPNAGAMDQYAAKLANRLLDNDDNDAVIEITMGSCKIQFEEDCTICITGADFSATIDNQSVTLNTAIQIQKGAVLSLGKRMYGVRTYLAIANGFQTDIILGSRSMYDGITPESRIKKGTIVPIFSNQQGLSKTFASVKINQAHFKSKTIECYKGPEFDLLSEAQKKQLFDRSFTISSDNSRMGYKLKESVKNNFSSMLTAAVLVGTVQLTPSGKLIVLMRNGPATGGYPRVLQLTEQSINRLAQKTTEDTIIFRIVTLKER